MKKTRTRIEAILFTLVLFLVAYIVLLDRGRPKPDRRQFGGVEVFVADVAGEQPRVTVVSGRIIDQADSTVLSKRTKKPVVVGTKYVVLPGQPAKAKQGRRPATKP
jgi:hypothetical protein